MGSPTSGSEGSKSRRREGVTVNEGHKTQGKGRLKRVPGSQRYTCVEGKRSRQGTRTLIKGPEWKLDRSEDGQELLRETYNASPMESGGGGSRGQGHGTRVRDSGSHPCTNREADGPSGSPLTSLQVRVHTTRKQKPSNQRLTSLGLKSPSILVSKYGPSFYS